LATLGQCLVSEVFEGTRGGETSRVVVRLVFGEIGNAFGGVRVVGGGERFREGVGGEMLEVREWWGGRSGRLVCREWE